MIRRAIFLTGILMLALTKTTAQGQEVEQLTLNIEKLSRLKEMLSESRKGTVLVIGGYKSLIEQLKENFGVHKSFLDGLLEVSPVVRNYKRVEDILKEQRFIAVDSKLKMQRIEVQGGLRRQEIVYVKTIYSNLLADSLIILDELKLVLSPYILRMSDDERLRAIDIIYESIRDKSRLLADFEHAVDLIVLQRNNDIQQLCDLGEFYGY